MQIILHRAACEYHELGGACGNCHTVKDEGEKYES